ncbi:hypothetical protein [Intestinimonas sp. HCP28S3_D6]|uniref:hypothetical protein n=1 Tax=Intestinimonas sp. HCP28S3_D6 TaxID=3438942 RepID=UPI003F8C43D6
MIIVIILLGILVVFFIGGALLESIGSLLGITAFAGLSLFKKIRDRRARKKAEKVASKPEPRRIEISCPCSEKFQVVVNKPGDVMMFTCPKCKRQLRVDTSKMV